MRKFLLSLVGLATVGAALRGVVSAQNLEISSLFNGATPKVEGAYAQLLTDYDSSWGYLDDVTVTCDEEKSTISIKSPKLYDEGYDVASIYRLFVSPYRLNQLKNNDVVVNSSKIIMKEVILDSDEVSFSLGANDGLEAGQAYYGFITPVDNYDEFGTPSKEICFILGNNQCMLGDACDNLSLFVKSNEEEHGAADDSHGAGCVGMEMANVTHTVKDGVLTLKWTAIPDGDIVEIAIFDTNAEGYKSLGTAKMNDERFTYKLEWNGEQNFLLTNGCGAGLRYKADAAKTTTPEPEDEPIVAPATGPAENILIIAVAAIVLYGLYTLFLRRPSN